MSQVQSKLKGFWAEFVPRYLGEVRGEIPEKVGETLNNLWEHARNPPKPPAAGESTPFNTPPALVLAENVIRTC